jgi:hypothetical protein
MKFTATLEAHAEVTPPINRDPLFSLPKSEWKSETRPPSIPSLNPMPT